MTGPASSTPTARSKLKRWADRGLLQLVGYRGTRGLLHLVGYRGTRGLLYVPRGTGDRLRVFVVKWVRGSVEDKDELVFAAQDEQPARDAYKAAGWAVLATPREGKGFGLSRQEVRLTEVPAVEAPPSPHSPAQSVFRYTATQEHARLVSTPLDGGQTPDVEHLMSLVSVHASQYASYTSLLWQVPALGLTAQSFLLTIALTSSSSVTARLIASVLGIAIAAASWQLMHDQRGRAINHAALLRRLVGPHGLGLGPLLGHLTEPDGTPPCTDAVDIWEVDHVIYGMWKTLMKVLAGADVLIFVLTLVSPSWLTGT